MGETTLVMIFKAQAAAGREVPDMHIDITEPLPAFSDDARWGTRARSLYRAQAAALARALCASLPGGTLDMLICELMERRATLLRIRYGG